MTILFCCNSDGSDKLEPLVIGKYKNPRCFKCVRNLPVSYTNNQSAWMTTALLQNWLIKLDHKIQINKKHILLFLDNFSGHKVDLTLNNIKIAFYPPNCTSVLQPLDQGLIKNFKYFYRTKLLRLIIARLDSLEVSETISMLYALHFVRSSWRDVKECTIKNCFAKAGHNINVSPILNELNSNELMITYCNIKNLQGVTFDVFVSADEEFATESCKTEQEIVDNVLNHQI